MTSTAAQAPANHIQCEAGDGPVLRGDAVIRSNGHRQVGWHPACFTVHRAVKDVDVEQVTESVGPLTDRLVKAGLL